MTAALRGASTAFVRDAGWHRAAGQARLLAWVSLVWMGAEGAIGLWQGFTVGSIALIGWALGSAVEGLASVIVVWRFTGERTLSDTAERRAQQAVAVSFWLLAPYVAIESVRDLASGHRAEANAGELWAVQVKAYGEDQSVTMHDMSQFLAESARRGSRGEPELLQRHLLKGSVYQRGSK
jgi:hypothetical protein